MDYPYTLKTGTLKGVLKKIPTTGIPSKFTIKHLETLGYKSTNDRTVISVLKFIGFIDSNGVPTEKYKEYRGKDREAVLANVIRLAYSELFNLHPNADKKDEETLIHFFATKTNAGARVQKAIVQTFKALCALGDFQAKSTPPEKTKPESTATEETIESKRQTTGIPININIELQMPPTDDPKVYEAFFKALKKYLLNGE